MRKNTIMALMLLGLTANAQTKITFETQDYQSVGIYDNWEASPFRTGQLKGNAAVVTNPDKAVDPIYGQAPNPSERVLAFQRSRFGSNTFGVSVRLKESFRLTRQPQYVHLMAYMPEKAVPSKCMLIGLGRHTEESWAFQDGTDEQFWALTSSPVKGKAGWQDLVFTVKGMSDDRTVSPDAGIDINTLIFVPDVRSPHLDKDDFVVYIDQIEINSDAGKRFSTDKYALSFEREQPNVHASRALKAVGLKTATGEQTAQVDGRRCYNDCTQTTLFSAKAGETATPTFDYSGAWMSGFAFVDWNRNGSYDLPDEKVSDQAEGNSIGTPMPAFQVAAAQTPGFYRMRYKVDWSKDDPAGNSDEGNLISNNGGGIVDVMLDVHPSEKVVLSSFQLNGTVRTVDGKELTGQQMAYGQAVTVVAVPADGFYCGGLTVRYGYDCADDEQLDANGNPKYLVKDLPRSADDTYLIPADCVRGSEVRILGNMISLQR